MRVIFCYLIIGWYLGLNAQNNYTQYVNPMIGTGGHGHTFPGATRPFAMVQLSPDTRIDGSWDGCSGYHYSDTLIYGFSHTHLSGTGCSDYGDIAFMPTITVGKLSEPIEKLETLFYDFSHKNEVSKAGYYSVLLNNGIKVELTSTIRVGLQQYTYKESGYAWITLNLKHRDELLEGKITQINKHTFSGLRRSKAWAEDQLLYYYFEVSRDAEEIIITKNEKGETKVNLGFKVKAGEKILVKTALSSVDAEGAKANMQKELPHWNFEQVKKEANAAWNTELNRIKAYGGTNDEKINFYTALYHCMIHPNVMNDVDGRYRGRDKQIHKAEGFDYYTVFSLWDTHRALHPLLNIIDKKRSHDFIMTFKAQFEQSGRLPMWELWSNETNCMIGFHSVSVILDAYNKGVITRDELKSLGSAVESEANSDKFGIDIFKENGFLSVENESESVSKTLEYAFDFYCVDRINCELEPCHFRFFRGQGWKNLYDKNSGFMRPRKNGGWLVPFDPKEVNNHFTEANAWQYSFAVPHDPNEINDTKRLSALFNISSETSGRVQADITGLIGQYAHGNEPSHHIAYLFNEWDSTKKYVSKICNEFYKPLPDGLCGNEDCGQMSAWYVFSAIGFYPVNPVSNEFYFGNMIFDSVRFQNGSENIWVYKGIDGIKNSNRFSNYIKLNENLLSDSRSFILQKDNNRPLVIGKTIRRSIMDSLLAIMDYESYYRPAPVIKGKERVFKDSMKVEIESIYAGKDSLKRVILYKFGREEPYKIYEHPITIYATSTLWAIESFRITENQDKFPSRGALSYVIFYKNNNNYTVKINSTYNKQYTADGDDGIIDGLQGDIDWRKGRWQGYQSQDFEAIIDLQTSKTVNKISGGFLQDSRSWILLPKQVSYYGSVDGITYELIDSVASTVPASDMSVQRTELSIAGNGKPYRYIKVQALNFGQLPAWHQGAGGDAFIFVDEITIE